MYYQTFVRGIGVFMLAGCVIAPGLQAAPRPQQSATSVVEAARKAREKKQTQRPSGKIYTNEDIAGLKGDVSVVGVAPAPPSTDTSARPAEGASAPTAGTTAPAPAPPKDEAYWRKMFADARKKLADDSKELDILQREFNLKQQQFYSDPNVALREQNSRGDLNATQQQIEAKKTMVESDKQAIAALEDDLRRSGGNASWSNEAR
jgi:hypothetical protein